MVTIDKPTNPHTNGARISPLLVGLPSDTNNGKEIRGVTVLLFLFITLTSGEEKKD